MGTKVMFENVRVAFPVLSEPEDYQGNKKFRWSATGLLPYGSEHVKRAEEAMKAEAKAKWGPKWMAYYENATADPKGCCLVDGKRKPEYAGYEGHMALTAHRQVDKGRPIVVDQTGASIYKAIEAGRNRDGSAILVTTNEVAPGMEGKIYAGMFVRLQVEFWAQQNDSGRALRATLLGIQAYAHGDAFGGGAAPDANDFGDITEGADADALG